METSSIILLIVSAAISFGVGRTIRQFRKKKRDNEAKARQLRALHDRPAEAESKNKSKRKRQLQQQTKNSGRP